MPDFEAAVAIPGHRVRGHRDDRQCATDPLRVRARGWRPPPRSRSSRASARPSARDRSGWHRTRRTASRPLSARVTDHRRLRRICCATRWLTGCPPRPDTQRPVRARRAAGPGGGGRRPRPAAVLACVGGSAPRPDVRRASDSRHDRQPHGEDTADPRRALHRDLAAHQRDETRRDGQAEPGAAEPARRRAVGLRERLEDALCKRSRAMPMPVSRTAKRERARPSRRRCRRVRRRATTSPRSVNLMALPTG